MKASWMSKVTIFIPNEDFREPSLYIIPLLMKHYGMKMPLYKHVTKSISHPNGVCKHKPSIIMDGISMKIWEPNIRTESTMPNTDKTNIIGAVLSRGPAC